jgi:hypothetical protein
VFTRASKHGRYLSEALCRDLCWVLLVWLIGRAMAGQEGVHVNNKCTISLIQAATEGIRCCTHKKLREGVCCDTCAVKCGQAYMANVRRVRSTW